MVEAEAEVGARGAGGRRLYEWHDRVEREWFLGYERR